MATIRQRGPHAWEIVIKRKGLLEKPYYATKDTESEAREYAAQVEALLDSGKLPAELLETPKTQQKVYEWMGTYQHTYTPSPSDSLLIPALVADIGHLRVCDLNQATLNKWIAKLKSRRLAPGTIRKRVGALARALDIAVHREILPFNPVRNLPRNYAAYTPADGVIVEDVARDRRLEPHEESALRELLPSPEWRLLFDLALETAMRLREMYTLDISQVDLDKRTIFLDKTKNGDKRQVPLSSVALTALEPYREKSGLLFPFWDGTGELNLVTSRLSKYFGELCDRAGCPDLHWHDLRHEATCRLFERTKLSDLQISLITGHREPRMLKRYANLRGSTLADALW